MEKMNSPKNILVYTKNRQDAELPVLSETDEKSQYVFVSDIILLKELIESKNPDLLIIDSDNDLSSENIKILIDDCVGRKLPVLIHSLNRSGKSFLADLVERTMRPGSKLTLHRRHNNRPVSERENLNIVNRTAATLSHEINNPLMAITANIETLLDKNGPLPNDIEDKIRLIETAARRIKSVTSQLTNLESLKYRETAAGQMINFEDETEPAMMELTAE